MKGFKFLSFCLLAFSCFICNAYGADHVKTKEKVVYLWDVTLSTKGYNSKTGKFDGQNIYGDVVKFLVKQIDGITDDNTDIYIIPFQHKVLDVWSAKSDNVGKKTLIDKIKKYENGDVTRTYISGPMEYAIDNLVDSVSRTFLYVLTDGLQNYPKESGMETLREYVRNSEWSKKSDETYMFYFAMTPAAVDPGLKEIIDDDSTAYFIGPDGLNMTWLDLELPDKLYYNIKDDSVINVTLTPRQDIRIPKGLSLKVCIRDNHFQINEIADVTDGIASIQLRGKYDYEKLKKEIPEKLDLIMNVELVGVEEIKNKEKVLVKLGDSKISLVLKNKPEKTLKIKLRNR